VLDHVRPSGPPASILVVDDDHDIRAALCEILTSEGYRVVHAANGADALSRLHAQDAPNLVLLDLRMPMMDGYEFLRRRDADSSLKGIPVIVVSATDVIAAAELRTTHPDIHSLRKPINLGLLFDLIRREITHRSANSSGSAGTHPPARAGIKKTA
jgi:CheY-like chemotaxis protein